MLWPIGFTERLYAPVAQLDRALVCGTRGRAFESRRVYHMFSYEPGSDGSCLMIESVYPAGRALFVWQTVAMLLMFVIK